MFPFDRFPYTDLHTLNLDWVLKITAKLREEYPTLVEEINKKLNKPLTDGVLNDILFSNGDGTTRWESFDATIGNQIAEAVAEWLAEHPEATTTVLDGSITPAKLDTELYNLYKQAGKVQFFFPNISTGDYSATSVLMVTPNKTVLFDADLAGNEDEVMGFFEQLYADGVFTNLDYIIISHYHNDHIGLLENFLTTFPHVGCKMYIPISPSGYYAGSQDSYLITNYNNVIAIAEDNLVNYTVVTADTHLDIEPGYVGIDLFNSNTTAYEYYSNEQTSYNDYSMYALVNIGNVFAMFPGDGQEMSQRYIMAERELPRLFLYAVHHHAIQNDDYNPYIYKINPQYSVIQTSHARQIASARASKFVKVANTMICSTAYDYYSFVCDGRSGDITHGNNLPNSGWLNTNITLYVDNSYTGDVHDGTQLRPFTDINEAIMFTQDHRNLKYTISVKGTAVSYGGVFVRDYDRPLIINGSDDPFMDNLYIQNCPDVTVKNIKITGTGYDNYPASSSSAGLIILSSNVVLSGCEIDGTNFTNSAASYACAITGSKLLVKSCTIKNLVYGFYSTTNYEQSMSQITLISTTFTTISDTALSASNIKFFLQNDCTFTSVTNILRGSTVTGVAACLAREYMTTTFASACTASAISEPIYKDATNPVVILANKKIFNVLTGEELT